jgi:hypothetical protein
MADNNQNPNPTNPNPDPDPETTQGGIHLSLQTIIWVVIALIALLALIAFGAFRMGSGGGAPATPAASGAGMASGSSAVPLALSPGTSSGPSTVTPPQPLPGATSGTPGTITGYPGAQIQQLNITIGRDGTVTTNGPAGATGTAVTPPATGRFTASGLYIFSLEDGMGTVEQPPSEYEFKGVVVSTAGTTNFTKWMPKPDGAPYLSVTPLNVGIEVQFSRGDTDNPANWTDWIRLSPTGAGTNVAGKLTAFRLKNPSAVEAELHVLFRRHR